MSAGNLGLWLGHVTRLSWSSVLPGTGTVYTSTAVLTQTYPVPAGAAGLAWVVTDATEDGAAARLEQAYDNDRGNQRSGSSRWIPSSLDPVLVFCVGTLAGVVGRELCCE